MTNDLTIDQFSLARRKPVQGIKREEKKVVLIAYDNNGLKNKILSLMSINLILIFVN